MRKWLFTLLIPLLLAACLFLPRLHASSEQVLHQHEVWPAATQAATGLHPDGSLTSHLPLIILKTQGQTIPGAVRSELDELPCEYAVIHNETGVNCSTDTPVQTGELLLSIRGNSSRQLPKKQYSLKLLGADGLPEDVPLLGLPAESLWVLNGSYIDHSMIRNYMLYNLSHEIMEYAPRTRLCEVLLTDAAGKPVYQGVYTLIEKPKVSDARLPLSSYDPRFTETSFMVQMNAHIDPDNLGYLDDNPITHLLPDNISAHNLSVEYPDITQISPQSLDYIQQQILLLDRTLYDSIHTHDWDSVEQCIDVDSFVDYFLINEFFQNYDAGSISTYFYRNNGGKLHLGPVWDFDSAFNNYHTDLPLDELRMQSSFYYYYLTQHKPFADRCIRRYHQLRQHQLSEENLLNYIDRAGAYLQGPGQRNSQLWYDDPNAFAEDLEDMKQFVRERGAWMDENFDRLNKVVQ